MTDLRRTQLEHGPLDTYKAGAPETTIVSEKDSLLVLSDTERMHLLCVQATGWSLRKVLG